MSLLELRKLVVQLEEVHPEMGREGLPPAAAPGEAGEAREDPRCPKP